ncbi:MAG TPA: hypothetical protein VLA88_03435 [Candidatus Saccharimonadales bacterium]|nr:hypothetical protein [Candidatus Saccharimonadales bacterium]
MNGRKSRHVAGLLLGVFLLGLAMQTLITARPAAAEAGQAFSISPPLIELKADRGQTVTTKIRLTNVSNDELLIKVQFNDFGAKDETGAPNIIFDDTKGTTYSLRNWIGSPAPFKVKSKETKTVEFPIQVPKDAEPGGHYATIRFTGTSTAIEDSGVALNASIGALVLMQVAGDIKEDAAIADFFSTASSSQTNFFESAPIGFVERIKNNGNVHIKPTGVIEVKNMFGSTIATLRVNGDTKDQKDQPKSILPQSIRRFEQTLSNQWLFGSYTATLKLHYGQGGKEITATTTFWVIPYKLIILGLVGLTALIVILRFGMRRYKQKILAEARGESFGKKPLKKIKR